MKQTALEKFIEQIKEYDFAVDTDEDYYIIRIPASVLKEKVEEAEKEEKQNIIDAWESGYKEGAGVNDFSIYHGNVYYNNTFKKI